jgi:hypothetical protein
MEALKIIHALDEAFEPFYDVFIPVLLKLCERTNRVFTSRATDTIHFVLKNSKSPTGKLCIPHFLECMESASKTLRLAAIKVSTIWITVDGYVEDILSVEALIIKAAEDAASEIREASRELFKAFTEKWPDRKESFISRGSIAVQKVLNLHVRKVDSKPLRPPLSSSRAQVNPPLLSAESSLSLPQRIISNSNQSHASLPASRPSSALRVPVKQVDFKGSAEPPRKLEFNPVSSSLSQTDFAPKRCVASLATIAPKEKEPPKRIEVEIFTDSLLKRSLSNLKKSSSTSSSGSFESVDNVQLLKTGSWSEKCEAIDSITLAPVRKLDSRLETALIECLSNSHHRVLQSVIDCVINQLGAFSALSLEEIILRFSAIYLNTQIIKTKPQIIASCEKLREALRNRLGSAELINILCSVQLRPDVAVNVKLRTVLIGFIANEILIYGSEFNSSLVKSLAMRMSVPIADHDDGLAQAAKSVFAALKQTMPETIYWGSIVPTVKSSSGRQRLRELEAIKKPPLAEGVSFIPVRSPRSKPSDYYPGQVVTPSKKLFAPIDEEISFKLRHTRLDSQ